MNPFMNLLRKRSLHRLVQPCLALTSGVLPLLLAGCGGSNNPGSSATAATPVRASTGTSSGQCPGNIDNTPFLGTYSGSYLFDASTTQDPTSVLVLPRDGTFRVTVSSDGTVQGTLNEGEASAVTLAGTATLSDNSFTASGTLPDDTGGTATVQVRGQYRIDACVPKVDGGVTVTDKGITHSYYFYGYPAT